MVDQWFTVEQVRTEQKACPLSVGQAEPGRYTFCIGDQCMAWQWLPQEAGGNIQVAVPADEIPVGWAACSEVYKKGKKDVVDIMQKPTHGRCGMVPRNVS